MSHPSQPSPSIAIVRALAAAHPGATLPCPVCATQIGGSNVELHLSSAHPERLAAPVGDSRGALRVTGVDKRSFVAVIGLLIAWGVGTTVVFALKVPLTDIGVAILGASFLVCAGVPGAAAAGAFKARLELDGDRVRLRWLLGSRVVPLPATLEGGVAIATEMKSTGVSAVDGAAKDVPGAYLCLAGGGAKITIATTEATEIGHRWSAGGWTRGDDIRQWDITVDRSAFIALELYLAARGQLVAPTEPTGTLAPRHT